MIRYLALGDSYTIGEQVLLTESFPYQLVQLARRQGIALAAPEIIARTGWTTDELQAAMETYQFQPPYEFVSLLIGVNNQYRGRTTEEYALQFKQLLDQAIVLAGGISQRVVVLSIPDWGVTPFAADRNREEIAAAINCFNEINQQLASEQAVGYIDITPGTREAATDSSLLAADALHPSPKEYRRWAERLLSYLSQK
ncbi:MAG: GDSL-type esterase/lipase family protein [Flavihumibacter sp.]|nr:GDSL-type esterase/lipase family protein [Flavihumibacter sp.]